MLKKYNNIINIIILQVYQDFYLLDNSKLYYHCYYIIIYQLIISIMNK